MKRAGVQQAASLLTERRVSPNNHSLRWMWYQPSNEQRNPIVTTGFYDAIAYFRKDLRITLEMLLKRPGGQTELWYNCSPNNDETSF